MVSLAVIIFAGRSLPNMAGVWVLIIGVTGIAVTLHGLSRGNPGAWATSSVVIAEPIVLGLLFPMAYQTGRDFRRLWASLDAALLAGAALGLAVYLQALLGFSLPISAVVDPTSIAVDLQGEGIVTNFEGYSALVFLAPYAIVRALEPGVQIGLIRRALIGGAAITGVLLSGRQVLYISVPLGILAAYVAWPRWKPRPIPIDDSEKPPTGRAPHVLVLVLTLLFTYILSSFMLYSVGLSTSDVLKRVISQVTLTDESGVRQVQSEVLLDAWSQNPILTVQVRPLLAIIGIH